ncbi:MAG: hypothetical protein ACI4Q4_04795, partial [Oscillospiraceae bacterium]
VQYVHVAKTLSALIADNRGDTGLSAYEQVLMNDISKCLDVEQDGYYYALIRKVNPTESRIGGANDDAVTIRVYSAHFSYERLPDSMGVDEFLYVEMGRLYGGQIMGSCSSEYSSESEYDIGYVIGDVNSYFMDAYDLKDEIYA